MSSAIADEPLLCLVNGEIGHHVAVVDRGLTYGDGLFETIRVVQCRPVLQDFHLHRLQAGLQRLGISVELAIVKQQFRRLLGLASTRGLGDGVVKLIVTRGVAGRGFGPVRDTNATIVFSWFSLPDYSPDSFTSGIELFTCQTRLAHRPHLAGLKHLNCLDYVMASLELRGLPDCEGLLLDQDGLLIEAISANLFMVSRGQLLTPALNRCGVAGTMRRWIMEVVAPQLGLVVAERDLSPDSLDQCEEIFICNSVRGVLPVSRVQGWQSRRGEVTAAIQNRSAMLFDA